MRTIDVISLCVWSLTGISSQQIFLSPPYLFCHVIVQILPVTWWDVLVSSVFILLLVDVVTEGRGLTVTLTVILTVFYPLLLS